MDEPLLLNLEKEDVSFYTWWINSNSSKELVTVQVTIDFRQGYFIAILFHLGLDFLQEGIWGLVPIPHRSSYVFVFVTEFRG